MRTIIEERITELSEEKVKILKGLTELAKTTTLPSEVISRTTKSCDEIDIRLSEAKRLLEQSKHFYGSKTPNLKQNDNGGEQ